MAEGSYYIDDETLRDRPTDEAEARRRVAELEELGEEGDIERVSLLRMLGDLDEAEKLAWVVVERDGGPGSREAALMTGVLPMEAVASSIRLAHVLHWKEDYQAASDLYSACLRSIENARMHGDERVPKLEAFTHQHLGKLRFDEGKVPTALLHFEQALKIREEIGAPQDQIDSSRKAVERAETVIAGS